MSGSEKLVFVVFVIIALGAPTAAAGVLVREIIRGFRRSGRAKSRMYIWLRRIVLPLAGAGVLCMAYAYFIEPYWLEVTRLRVDAPGLAGATRPIRIVHISDLQCDEKVRLEEDIPPAVAALKPDIICFTGDAVNSLAALTNFRICMARLTKIAPVYAVRGNWDTGWKICEKLFADTGVNLLEGQAVKVNIAGVELCIAGAPDRSPAALKAALNEAGGDYSILLYHRPDEIYYAAERKVDLYLAGHTHGGQVALPFYGAMITLSRYGKRFEAGHYRVGDTDMYVSRGIGMEGRGAPRVRFFARPEVTLIELVPPTGQPSSAPASRPGQEK